jgi:hypothetical protein
VSGREHDKAFTCSPVSLEFGLKSRPLWYQTMVVPLSHHLLWWKKSGLFGWLDWQTNTQATCIFISESHKFVQDHESTFAARENDMLPAYKLEQIMWSRTHCMDFTTTQIINFLALSFRKKTKVITKNWHTPGSSLKHGILKLPYQGFNHNSLKPMG